MFKLFAIVRSFALMVVALMTVGLARADFPKDLLAKHPCLKEVSQPWHDPMKADALTADFKAWDTVYVGHWNELDGSKVCSAFLLNSVNGDGSLVQATYTNATPYKREHMMRGKFFAIDGKKALRIEKFDWWVQYVMNDDGTLAMTNSITPKTGVLYPANRTEKLPAAN